MRYLGFAGLLLLTATSTLSAADVTNEIRVIVKYKNSPALTTIKQQLAHDIALPLRAMQPMANDAYVLTFANAHTQAVDVATIITQLKQNPAIQYAVNDRIGHFKPLPKVVIHDPVLELSHALQWDEFLPPGGVMLESASGAADGAWAYTRGQGSSKPVVVAVLDTGIEPNPALIDNILKDDKGAIWGWNFAANNRDMHDETESYHGTHVAGTIAGYGNIVTGMGDHLKILPLKIPDASGMFYESQVINAIYWSVGKDVPGVPHNPYPAKVLNMSFGVDLEPGKEIDHCDEALQEALFYIRGKGAVVAAAAGNDDRWEHYNAPAVCNATIKVAATGPKGLRAYYSNFGPSISYAAPGGDKSYGDKGAILSTVNPGGGYLGSGFDFYQGTSMASPHAAGIAGLIYAVNNKISPQRVEQILYSTTHDFGKGTNAQYSCTGKKPCGHGILDAEDAVLAAIADYDVLFSAPVLRTLQSCKADKRPKLLSAQGATWKLIHSDCQFAQDDLRPHIKLNDEGLIEAHYGKTVYQLDTSDFKQCQVIGFDGVGCYQ